MKRKKLNSILIIAVSLIWGVVLYKFLAPYFTETPQVLTAEALVVKPRKATRKKDTVVLDFPERDPFLGKKLVNKKVKPPAPVRAKTRTSTPLKPVLWPKIEYLGFIKSKNSDGRLGLLRIDGVLHRVNRNMVVKDLKIISIDNEEIRLKNGKEEKSFTKT